MNVAQVKGGVGPAVTCPGQYRLCVADRGSRAPRVDQKAHHDDVEAVGYGPDDPVVVTDRYAHLPRFHERSGRDDDWNDRLMHTEPSSVYMVDGRYLYVTDHAGRFTHAEG